MGREAQWATVYGVAESQTTERLSSAQYLNVLWKQTRIQALSAWRLGNQNLRTINQKQVGFTHPLFMLHWNFMAVKQKV